MADLPICCSLLIDRLGRSFDGEGRAAIGLTRVGEVFGFTPQVSERPVRDRELPEIVRRREQFDRLFKMASGPGVVAGSEGRECQFSLGDAAFRLDTFIGIVTPLVSAGVAGLVARTPKLGSLLTPMT